jgi:NADH-quinone oxidoreductase subunit I
MNGNKLKGANNTYFGNLAEGIKSSWQGLKVSIKHVFEARRSRKPMGVAAPDYFDQQTGIVTLKYPYEALPVPDNGRYRLHNEMEDCIVCDKCAEICPVNASRLSGKVARGNPQNLRRAFGAPRTPPSSTSTWPKCCFCGLCTTVCPPNASP